jgi:hypothetical protein
MMRSLLVAIAPVIVLGCASHQASSVGRPQTSARTPVAATPRFAFYSDFETNLNDALIAAGVAQKAGEPELFRSGGEAECFGKLPETTRAGWDRAVAYYADSISPAAWSDRAQYLLRLQLVGFDEELTDSADRAYVGRVRAIRAAAAAGYTACRWPAQDEKNRRWIAEARSQLAVDEEKVASRLEQLYQQQWTGLPLLVDVVETVDWSGANTIFRIRGGGHLLISNAYQGSNELEIVFHEASHLLMGRTAPVKQALDSAARAADFRLPGNLWHVVLFYTTGEVVRRVLADDGKPAYTPIVYELFAKNVWDEDREALERAWLPYVEGKRPLPEAASALVEAVKQAENKP